MSEFKLSTPLIRFLHKLKSSRLFLLFLATFLIGNGLFHRYYSDLLLAFSHTVKVYKIENALQKYPTETLTDKIYGSAKETENINRAGNILIFVMWGSVEGFLIFSVVKYRKKYRKLLLTGYFLVMQPLLIVPILVLVIAQGNVVDDLLSEAKREIPGKVDILTDHAKLGTLGIENDSVRIAAGIAGQSVLPTVIEDNTEEAAIYKSYSIASGSADTFYRAIIIPYQLNNDSDLINKKKSLIFDSLLFPDNTLIVRTVSSGVMNKLVPLFSSRLVSSYFSTASASVVVEPAVDTPDPVRYLAIRKRENEKQRDQIVGLVQSAKSDLFDIDRYIADTEACEQKNAVFYGDLRGRVDTWYASCVSDLGASDSVCSGGKMELETKLAQIAKDRDECREYKIKFSDLRPKFVSNLAFAQKILDNFDANPVLPEYEGGVFLPPRTIHLKFEPDMHYPFSSYLAAGVHEQLHFLSYNTGEGRPTYLPHFLEEGITEYLSKRVRGSFLGRDVGQVSYPDEVGVVRKIEELLGKDELESIYFTKDSPRLKKLIDKRLSNGTYDALVQKGGILALTKLEDVDIRSDIVERMLDLLSGKEQAVPASLPRS